ncbi:MAG: 5'-methylthioadenosine/adenosylhomocysteine nucleosidase [Salinibacter sp.]
MPLAIMSAMEVEMELYLDRCEIHDSTQRAGLTFHRAGWHGHELVLVKAGVGKVNAAVCTQLLIGVFEADAVICTGSAGALTDELDIGDIVVATDCVQHDVLVEFLGLPRGQIPFTDHRFFGTTPALRRRALEVDLGAHTVVEGRVLTGDTFVEEKDYRQALREELDGDCVEMEGAAVGQVCAMNDVPYLVVRAISDRADGSSDVDFEAFLEEAAYSSSRIVLHTLESMSSRSAPE